MARKNPTDWVMDKLGGYARSQKKRLDEKGTLDLGIAPKFGPVFGKSKSDAGESAKAKTSRFSQANRPVPGKVTQANRPMPKGDMGWKTSVRSEPPKSKTRAAASSGPIDNRKPGRNREELGAFYLNATSGMDVQNEKKRKR